MPTVSQLLRGRAKTEPRQLEKAEREGCTIVRKEEEGPAKVEGAGGRNLHARYWAGTWHMDLPFMKQKETKFRRGWQWKEASQRSGHF